MEQWKKGEILISREPKTLVLYMGDGIWRFISWW